MSVRLPSVERSLTGMMVSPSRYCVVSKPLSAVCKETATSSLVTPRGGRAADRRRLRGDPLCLLVDGGRTIGHQRCLAGQRVGDAGAQQRPLWLGNVEVAPEVEQGALAHGVAEAFGVDQPMGEVGLAVAGASGLGAPNEHGATIAWRTCVAQGIL